MTLSVLTTKRTPGYPGVQTIATFVMDGYVNRMIVVGTWLIRLEETPTEFRTSKCLTNKSFLAYIINNLPKGYRAVHLNIPGDMEIDYRKFFNMPKDNMSRVVQSIEGSSQEGRLSTLIVAVGELGEKVNRNNDAQNQRLESLDNRVRAIEGLLADITTESSDIDEEVDTVDTTSEDSITVETETPDTQPPQPQPKPVQHPATKHGKKKR